MAPKNWKPGECFEPRKLNGFGREFSLKLKKLEGFFQEGESEELAIKKSE